MMIIALFQTGDDEVESIKGNPTPVLSYRARLRSLAKQPLAHLHLRLELLLHNERISRCFTFAFEVLRLGTNAKPLVLLIGSEPVKIPGGLNFSSIEKIRIIISLPIMTLQLIRSAPSATHNANQTKQISRFVNESSRKTES